jgi:uncharacterized protein (UPF0218 family)
MLSNPSETSKHRARTIAPGETDEEVVYEKVTTVLKQRIQQLLDEMRRGN